MLILAFESSAKAASVALLRDNDLLGLYFQNCGLTHSATLLPMAEDLLRNTGLSLKEVELLAVSHGPGSFTGVRIGVSTVKGLAWAGDRPVCGISTLEAMAFQVPAAPGDIICSVMDARRGEVYNALFEYDAAGPKRQSEDRAIAISDLAAELENKKNLWLVGDGAQLCADSFAKQDIIARLPHPTLILQNAWGVAVAARTKEPISGRELLPVYLRLSQAERERQERLCNNG